MQVIAPLSNFLACRWQNFQRRCLAIFATLLAFFLFLFYCGIIHATFTFIAEAPCKCLFRGDRKGYVILLHVCNPYQTRGVILGPSMYTRFAIPYYGLPDTFRYNA